MCTSADIVVLRGRCPMRAKQREVRKRTGVTGTCIPDAIQGNQSACLCWLAYHLPFLTMGSGLIDGDQGLDFSLGRTCALASPMSRPCANFRRAIPIGPEPCHCRNQARRHASASVEPVPYPAMPHARLKHVEQIKPSRHHATATYGKRGVSRALLFARRGLEEVPGRATIKSKDAIVHDVA